MLGTYKEKEISATREIFYQPGLFSGFLACLAFYTLAVKFFVPSTLSVAMGEPWHDQVLWDFWWVAHLVLAAALLRPRPWVRPLALAVAGIEILIVSIKFLIFFQQPALNWLRLHWFYNKLAVVGVFTCLLISLIRNRQDWTDAGF